MKWAGHTVLTRRLAADIAGTRKADGTALVN